MKMEKKFFGKSHIYGDNVDTDVIIPARYLNTSDEKELSLHCMEDIDKNFVNNVKQGDIMVGGENFGCGSSREHAPISIKASGISCIIAKSFARIFFRNAINIGLPIFEQREFVNECKNSDEIEVDIESGIIKNVTQNKEYKTKSYPQKIQNLIQKGGLINYTKEKLNV